VDADATDGTDADGSDELTRTTVAFSSVVRGTGVIQQVTGTGFTPGETVSATVNSTPMPLTAQTAGPDGRVVFTFPIGADFELGAHSVTVTGSVSGPTDLPDTDFTVVAKTVPAGQPGTPIRGGNGGYGGGILPVTGGGSDGLFLLGGIALLMLLTGAGALHQSRRRQA